MRPPLYKILILINFERCYAWRLPIREARLRTESFAQFGRADDPEPGWTSWQARKPRLTSMDRWHTLNALRPVARRAWNKKPRTMPELLHFDDGTTANVKQAGPLSW